MDLNFALTIPAILSVALIILLSLHVDAWFLEAMVPHFLSDQPACDQGLEMRAGGNKEAFKKDGNGDLMVFISCIFAEFLRCEDGETCDAYQKCPLVSPLIRAGYLSFLGYSD